MTAPRNLPRVRLAASMAMLSVLPDADVIGFRFGVSYGDALGHRGFTHSIAFALLAGVVAALLAFREVRPPTVCWWILVGFLSLATLSHGFLDAFTDAGLGVGFFIPFENTRYFAPWRPLATSPLSVQAFLEGPALAILANELLFVGIPLASLILSVLIVQRWIRRGKG